MIAIHGRTLRQSHSGDVDWDFISKIKEKADPACNIIGNGGIKETPGNEHPGADLDGLMI